MDGRMRDREGKRRQWWPSARRSFHAATAPSGGRQEPPSIAHSSLLARSPWWQLRDISDLPPSHPTEPDRWPDSENTDWEAGRSWQPPRRRRPLGRPPRREGTSAWGRVEGGEEGKARVRREGFLSGAPRPSGQQERRMCPVQGWGAGQGAAAAPRGPGNQTKQL